MTTTAWPALYDPFIDLLRIAHRDPIQPGGHYLYHANDIFRFTLYWTLIFYLPIFVLSGVLASANIAFAPKLRHQSSSSKSYAEEGVLAHNRHEAYPLAPLNATNSAADPVSPTSPTFPTSPSPSGTAVAAKTGVSSPDPDSGPVYSGGAGPPAARVSTSTSITPSQPLPESASSQQKVQAQLNNPHRTRAVYALLVLLTYLVAGFLGAVVGSIIVGYVLAGLYKSGGFFMSTWIPPLFALVQTLIGVLGIYPSIAEII